MADFCLQHVGLHVFNPPPKKNNIPHYNEPRKSLPIPLLLIQASLETSNLSTAFLKSSKMRV